MEVCMGSKECCYVVKERFVDVDGSMKLPGERVSASADRAMLLRRNGKIGGVFGPHPVETAVAAPVAVPDPVQPVVENAVACCPVKKRKKKGR